MAKQAVMHFSTKAVAHQIVYGEVYIPYSVDTDREAMHPEDIQKMAWDFLSQGKSASIDIQHNFEKSGCTVVESFIARKGDLDFAEGSWVLGVKCTDEVWAKVLAGELNGFSFAASVEKVPAKVLIEIAKQIAGITEKSTREDIPSHEHAFVVNLDNKGVIVSGRTDKAQGHSHSIATGTMTEVEAGHSHRIVLD